MGTSIENFSMALSVKVYISQCHCCKTIEWFIRGHRGSIEQTAVDHDWYYRRGSHPEDCKTLNSEKLGTRDQ